MAFIRHLSKFAVANKVLGDAEHKIRVYTSVHEDSSTASTQQFTATVGFGKMSIQRPLGSALLVAIVLCLLSSSVIGFMLTELIIQQRIVQNYQANNQTICQKQTRQEP